MVRIKLPTQKQFPKKIYFNDACYAVVFKKDLDCFGETDPNNKRIVVKDGLSPRALLATVIHELLHVIEFEKPMKLKHKDVYKLEQSILELLIDNFL